MSKTSRKIKRLWMILGIEVVIAAIMMVLFVVQYTNQKLGEIQIEDIEVEEIQVNEGIPEEQIKKYTTIVLFGLDSRNVKSDTGNRSDSIIIVSIDDETKEVKLVSVFRDTYVEISNVDGNYDETMTRVNHAYAYGGPKAAIDTLNKNLDLQITEYATVNFASLTDAINDLGGIVVNVDEAERLELNHLLPETASIAGMSYRGLYETGDVTLDGLQATTYCRIRATDNDIMRAGRQREVLQAMLEKAKKSDVFTLNKLLDDVLPEISTSLTKKEILSLTTDLLNYEIVGNEGYPYVYHYQRVDGMDVEIPGDVEHNAIILHEFLYGINEEEPYEPSPSLKKISEEIKSYTGVYPHEDPGFRGGY